MEIELLVDRSTGLAYIKTAPIINLLQNTLNPYFINTHMTDMIIKYKFVVEIT